MRERHDTVVVGGGQAGLAMSAVLQRWGREHVVLERRRVAERWRTERWDSLRFQFPNWSLQLPGYSYRGSDPDGFAHYGEIIRLLEAYATDIPVREHTAVVGLGEDHDHGGFVVSVAGGALHARRVVVATGPFQRPHIPRLSRAVSPSVLQLDPTRYRCPAGLPDGAVLVVGSGGSGCQIADELSRAGRRVYLSVSRHRRVPRPDPRPELFLDFMPRIKDACAAVLNVSTGGGLGMTRAERLRAAVATSPEMASLNVGSLNFGIFPMLEKYSRWKHDWEPAFLEMTRDHIFRNTFADLEHIVKELGQGHGTRFEFECYDLGHLYNLAWLIDQDWLEPPFFVQLVFGVLGGVGADLDNLQHLHTIADKLFGNSYEWSVLAAGRHQMPFATQAAMLGGNLPVGMEDSLFIGPGELTPSNAAQVRKIRGIIEALGFEVATPAQARERLALKGADHVAF